MIVLSVVVLPAPLRPTRQTTSRAPTSSETDRRIWLAWTKTSTSARVGPAGPGRPGRGPDPGADPPPVRLDRRRCGVGHHLALVERDDAIGVGEHDVHVVFHLDDRPEPDPPRGRDQRLHDRRLVRGAHPRCRLVEEDDLRSQGECGRHVEELLVSLRQLPRQRVTLVAEAEQLGHLERGLLHLAIPGERGEQAAASPQSRHAGGLQGLEDRQVGKDLDELERPGHAETRQAHRADAADLTVLEAHAARAWSRDAGEDVDERRLAGAVGPDDRDELARVDPEAHAVEGTELSVEFSEPVRLQNHARDAGTGRRRVTSPMSPCGAKMTMTASIAPKISRQYGTIDITQFCR